MMNACLRWSFLAVPLLSALGCSDPVPPPAQGAVTLDVSQPVPTVNQMSCPITKVYQVGAKDSKTMATLAPTAQDPGESVISGENGSTISCSVTGGGGNFKFSGSLHASTPDGDLILVAFQNGVISGSTGTADVSVYTPELSSNFAGTGCTINVQTGQCPSGMGTCPQVKGGSIWASFSCPQISAAPSGLCGISIDSTIVFENCSGS